MRDLDGLRKENARLRGLVRALIRCAYTKDCDGCGALDARGRCRLGEMLELDGFEREGDGPDHGPTVEDVLRDFAEKAIRIAAKDGIDTSRVSFYTDEDALFEYAAKLQLREEE